MAMNAFRRSVANETKQKGGKGGKGSFYERMRLPKSPSMTSVLFLRGSYPDPNPPQELQEIDPVTRQVKPVVNDFFKTVIHTRKVFANGKENFYDEPCSQGSDPHNPQPCAGCSAQDQGDKSVGKKDQYAFSVIHMHPYHMHPLLDRTTGQIVTKRETNPPEPVMVFSECEGRTCNFCRVERGEQPVLQQGQQWPGWQRGQFTTTFGHRRYLELGKSHLSDLEGFENTISSLCGTCNGQLTTMSYSCPTCNSVLIDMARDPRTDPQIAEAIVRPYACLNCNRGVLVREDVKCESCEAAKRPTTVLSMFDSVLNLFRQGEGTKSHIMMQRYTPIDAFGQQIQAWLGQKSIRQLIEEIGKPYDFVEMYKPRSLDEQRKRLQLNPPQSAYGAYGQQPMYGAPGGAPAGYHQQQPQQFMGPTPGGTFPPPFQPNPTGYLPPGGMPQPVNMAAGPAPQYAAPQQYAQPQQAPQPAQYVQYPTPGAPQNNAPAAPGPAPFQPAARPNYGS